MKVAYSTVFVPFNYSTSFSNEDFSLLQLIVQIYKLSHTALKAKAKVVKVKHNLLRIAGQSEQNITTNTGIHAKKNNGLTAGVTSSCCSWSNALW